MDGCGEGDGNQAGEHGASAAFAGASGNGAADGNKDNPCQGRVQGYDHDDAEDNETGGSHQLCRRLEDGEAHSRRRAVAEEYRTTTRCEALRDKAAGGSVRRCRLRSGAVRQRECAVCHSNHGQQLRHFLDHPGHDKGAQELNRRARRWFGIPEHPQGAGIARAGVSRQAGGAHERQDSPAKQKGQGHRSGAGAASVPLALLLGWGVLALMGAAGLAGNSGPGDSGALWMFRDPEPPSSATVQLLRAFVVAGMVEEVAKLLAVIAVAHRALTLTDRSAPEAAPADASAGGLVAKGFAPRRGPVLLRHGAAAGMGFAVLEAAAQLVGSAGFVVLRVVMVIPLHAALTGIVFVAVGGSISRRARKGRGRPVLAGLVSVTFAAAVHGAFNLLVGPIVVGAAMIVATVLIVAIVTNGVVVSESAEVS